MGLATQIIKDFFVSSFCHRIACFKLGFISDIQNFYLSPPPYQNLSLPEERSNRETSRTIGFYSVYLVSLKVYHNIYIDRFRAIFRIIGYTGIGQLNKETKTLEM